MGRRSAVVVAVLLAIGGCKDSPPELGTGTGTGSGSDSGAEASTSAGTSEGADETAQPLCDPANHVPDKPTLLAPAVGAELIDPGDLVIQGSPFVDADGDTHASSEFEIWRVVGGRPSELSWTAFTWVGPALTEVRLVNGELQGAAALLETLRLWDDHVVRVRYNDGSNGDANDECGWSEWSDYVPFRTDDGSARLFDQSIVQDLYLEIPPESWDPIDAQAIPPGCVPWNRDYYAGTLTFEDQVFEGVGIRAKGGCGSARGLYAKAAFRINLGWDDPAVPGCPEETRRLFGQQHLTLNNMVQDPSFLHERLAYRVYQAFGVPTPRVAHIRVHVNGVPWGLYLLVETPKRRFLERRFESKNGMLYEGTYWCDLIAANLPPADEDTYCLERKFSPSPCDGDPDPDADPKTYDPLRTLIGQLDAIPPAGFYPAIEDIFAYDQFLSAWAVEGVVAHWDGYSFDIMNNYRVYHHPPTDLWHLLPHGLDQTFGGDLDPWNVSGRLAVRCMQEPDCEAAFAARLAEVNDTFEALDLASEVDAIHALIAEDVYADPRKEVSNFDYDAQQTQAQQWILDRPQRVRDILALHGF